MEARCTVGASGGRGPSRASDPSRALHGGAVGGSPAGRPAASSYWRSSCGEHALRLAARRRSPGAQRARHSAPPAAQRLLPGDAPGAHPRPPLLGACGRSCWDPLERPRGQSCKWAQVQHWAEYVWETRPLVPSLVKPYRTVSPSRLQLWEAESGGKC